MKGMHINLFSQMKSDRLSQYKGSAETEKKMENFSLQADKAMNITPQNILVSIQTRAGSQITTIFL